jgi:hypothetical protein
VRWGIDNITVTVATATVVTQEVNIASEKTTVRVTYTLRWDAATGRWLIGESEMMSL